MHVGTSLSLSILVASLAVTTAFPISESSRVPENAGDKSVGRLAFTLADPASEKTGEGDGPKGSFMDVISALTKSTFFQKFMQFIGGVASTQQADAPKKMFATRIATPQADLPVAARNFEASLSHDDAIESVASGASIIPMASGPSLPSTGPHKSINDESFTHLLFGEQGVLTNVFHVMDAQRQNQQASMVEQARRAQADPSNAKINNLDFAKVFDTLMMGGQKKNEFGEPGPELPEFLGICNRLSCGDIYKAIDEFRRSDFFSNFQTALQLVQDPKGWEILGKMLSNPELIASFTGGAGGGAVESAVGGAAGGGVGAGIGSMLGSALGGAKAAVAKEGGDVITNKDGDFGTDFSQMAKIDKESFFKLPETSFSVDAGEKGAGAGEDYYSEIVSNIDEDFEVEDRDILGLPTKPTTTTTTSTTTTTAATTTTTRAARTTAAAAAASTRPPNPTIPPSTAIVTSAPFVLLPKKEEIEMPDFEFNIDEEDYGTTFEKSIDSMPPVDAVMVVDEKVPSVPAGTGTSTSTKILLTTTTTATPSSTTARPVPIVPAPRAVVPVNRPVPVPVVTVPPSPTTPLVISPSLSTRPVMRRISIAGVVSSTAAPKNFRKESDYYAMYYDH